MKTKGKPQKHQQIRVLIIEDHPFVREGLCCVLGDSAEISVVGQAETGEDGVIMARDLKPDVLVVDIELPRMDGLDVAEIVRRELPESRVILLSVHRNARHLERATRSGVHGYLLKDAPLEGLLETVLNVGRKDSERLVATPIEPSALEQLSELDRQILVQLANGKTHKQISQIFGITERRVRSHRELITGRFNIKSKAGFTRFAIAHGLIPPPTK